MVNNLLPPWIVNLEKSGIQKALQTTDSNIISFSLGKPDNDFLELLATKEPYKNLFSPENLQYFPPSSELKAHIADLMKEKLVFCKPEEIFLTTGAQQAMTLLTKLFISEGDHIIVDSLTYPGFIQVAQAARAKLIPAPLNCQKGFEKELKIAVERNKKPKMIYTMSEGHNPLGTNLDPQQRLDLTHLAEHYQIPIIEDDAYGFLTYEEVEPPLKSCWKKGVFYIGSFSKILAPSLRVGWIIASEPIIEKLEILKEGLDINTSTLSQKIVSVFFEKGELKEHISKLRDKYKIKRDVMVESLKKYIPEMTFSIPKSGFFIWGQLPTSIDTNRLFKLALEKEKISFLPGEAFLVGQKRDVQNCLRLSFSFCPIDQIEEGVNRLARAIHED